MTGWKPPVELYSASDKSTFAYESTTKRWPRILTQQIDELNGSFDSPDVSGNPDKLKEAKELINQIANLKYEIMHDRALPPLEQDEGANIALYNEELQKLIEGGKKTWFQMPWLFAECYLYRQLRILFASTEHWKNYDIFAKQKIGTFRSAGPGVYALALRLNDLIVSQKDAEAQQAGFLELAQVALWGNATDLSLLQGLSHADIQALQKTGKAAQQEAEHLILVNNLDQAWQHLQTLQGAQISIVLDNAGFELYGDLLMADWLLSTPFCSKVVFHPKDIPWFVSDVLPTDIETTLHALADPSFFKLEEGEKMADAEHKAALNMCLSRWRTHFATGRFEVSLPLKGDLVATGKSAASSPESYWTSPLSFAIIPERSPELLKDLQKAGLTIFKGDLNARKLMSDAKWDTTTPFDDVLGPLRGQLNILALRTLKADVCVGLPEGTAEKLDKEDPNWRVSGKYAVVYFSKRA